MNNYPPFEFPFRRQYQTLATITLQLPPELGSERRTLSVQVEKTLEFHSTEVPNIGTFKILEQKLTLPEYTFVTKGRDNVTPKPFRLPELVIGTEVIETETSTCYVNLDTGEFVLDYRIHILASFTSILESLGIDDIPIIVHEAGKINLREGLHYQASFYSEVDPHYTGKMQLLSFWGIKCETWTKLEVGLSSGECVESLASGTSGGSVYICEGESVFLCWDSSSDVTSAHLKTLNELGHEIDSQIVSPKGSMTVTPRAETGYYKIEANGDCERISTVTIHVIRGIETITITALPVPAIEAWVFKAPKSKTSQNIKVNNIEPRCELGCYAQQPPLLNKDYLRCGGILCEGEWFGRKLDSNGTLTDTFNTGYFQVPLPSIPLEGEWQFIPLGGITSFSGNAYFSVSLHCGS